MNEASANGGRARWAHSAGTGAALLGSGIVLFALAHPNAASVKGFPLLSYGAYAPIFVLAGRTRWRFVWFAGLLYGVGAYCFFGYWLAAYNPNSMGFIAGLFGAELMLVFPALKLAAMLFPRNGWLAQWLVWIAYEYVKTLGFAGFQYGITAYTHWRWTPLIQIASVTGVWGLNALIVFVSAWIAAAATDAERDYRSGVPLLPALKRAVFSHRISACVWAVCFAAVAGYGMVAAGSYPGGRTVKVVLAQPDSDPWKGGVPVMRRDLDVLLRLTSEALQKTPDAALVVWPETAFVPRIVRHYRARDDRDRFALVERLLEYIDRAGTVFVLGNDHAENAYDHTGRFGEVDYNAALLFVPRQNVIPPEPVVYRKMHLVPFTEYFPFERQFPAVYRKLLAGDTHLWEPGAEPVVFSAAGIRFSTPICFEDTFGYIVRKFVRNGAEVIVNMSNDAWAKNLVCQYQHLSMALFRSVENRVPSVRATASGETVIIAPNGKITARAEPFTATYLTGEVPVRQGGTQTLYTRWGDAVGQVQTAAAAVVIFAGIIRMLRRKYGKKSDGK